MCEKKGCFLVIAFTGPTVQLGEKLGKLSSTKGHSVPESMSKISPNYAASPIKGITNPHLPLP